MTQTPSPPPYKCHHCRDQRFVGGYDGGPGSGQAEPCPRCNYTPPPALVEKVARAYLEGQSGLSRCYPSQVATNCPAIHCICYKGASAALAASGMGDLVALLTRWLALYAGEYDEALVHMCGEAEAAVVTEARALLRKIEGG